VLYEAKLVAGEDPDMEIKGQILCIGNVIKEDSISALRKLLRVTAWLLRFTDRLKKRAPEKGPLKASELRGAKLAWDLFIRGETNNTNTRIRIRSIITNELF